jgi:hypothetical protein
MLMSGWMIHHRDTNKPVVAYEPSLGDSFEWYMCKENNIKSYRGRSIFGRECPRLDGWMSAPMKSATVFDEFDKRHPSIENKLVNLAKALSKKSKTDHEWNSDYKVT